MRKVCCIQEVAVLERQQEAKCPLTDTGEVWVLSCKQCDDTRINQDNNIVRARLQRSFCYSIWKGQRARATESNNYAKAFQFSDLIPNTTIMKHLVPAPSGGGYGEVKGRQVSCSLALRLTHVQPAVILPRGHQNTHVPPGLLLIFFCLFVFGSFPLLVVSLKMPYMLMAGCTGEGHVWLAVSGWVRRNRDQTQGFSSGHRKKEDRRQTEKVEFLGVGIEILKAKKKRRHMGFLPASLSFMNRQKKTLGNSW